MRVYPNGAVELFSLDDGWLSLTSSPADCEACGETCEQDVISLRSCAPRHEPWEKALAAARVRLRGLVDDETYGTAARVTLGKLGALWAAAC